MSGLASAYNKTVRQLFGLGSASGYSMKKRWLTIAALTLMGCALLGAPAVFALDWQSGRPPLPQIEPQPKEIQFREGGFKVGPRTRIFVLLGHQSEDRIAAETLAEEVEDQSGLKLDILGMKPAAKAEDGAIVLARLQDDRVKKFLAQNGLKADDAVGEDGYLLFSDNSHLIVAANTGQGIFYGVQTLRQLLRPAGKGLVCPAIGIRDWPSLERVSSPDATHDAAHEVAHQGPPPGN